MNQSRQLLLPTLALLLFAGAQSARAENWVAVGTHSEVDTDSIHKADDGFVHYLERDPVTTEDSVVTATSYEEAFDCSNMISYVGLDEADWQTKGSPVNPNTHGSTLMDFVCSRVPVPSESPAEPVPEPAVDPAPEPAPEPPPQP